MNDPKGSWGTPPILKLFQCMYEIQARLLKEQEKMLQEKLKALESTLQQKIQKARHAPVESIRDQATVSRAPSKNPARN
jgi:hypothetical protein